MKILLKNDNPVSEMYLRYADLFKRSDKYDCVVLSRNCKEDVLNSYKRILLIEKLDCASIWCRTQLKHPHVKTLLKLYHYKDLNIHNKPCVGGRAFIPYDGTQTPLLPELTQEDFNKVQPGLNFLHYKHMETLFDILKNSELKPTNMRAHQSFFAGTTRYTASTPSPAGRWISRHRLKHIQRLKSLQESKMDVIISDNKSYSQSEYYQIMMDTKMIYSPFGWGEFCYRDYEAILCGCVLMKPFFLETIQIPDIRSCIQFTEECNTIDSSNLIHYSEWLRREKENEKQIIERILE